MKEIVGKYEKSNKSGINLRYLDFSEIKNPDSSALFGFQSGLRQQAMFKEKKLIIFLNPFRGSLFKDLFSKHLKDFADSNDIIVIAEEGKPLSADPLFKSLKAKSKCQEFVPLSGLKLKNWIAEEFEKCGARIEPGVADAFAFFIGSDLWRMSNEIKKLSAYRQKGIILKSDALLSSGGRDEADIFKTIDAIAVGDKKSAMRLIHCHLEAGDHPLKILTMISFQFRNLLSVKDLIEKGGHFELIAKKSGLHPYVARKSYFQCQRFSLSELKKIYQKIFQADIDIKTGKADPIAALDLLVADI